KYKFANRKNVKLKTQPEEFRNDWDTGYELPKNLKPKFEANPLEFIYHNAGLQFQEQSGIKPRTMVPALFEAEGLYGKIDEAKEQARYMQGASTTRRTLGQLAKMMAEQNPSLLVTWKAANPALYERWAMEVNDKNLR